jgi:cytochrome c556
MPHRLLIAALCLGLALNASAARAHGSAAHGGDQAAQDQMKKLHAMMPMFSIALADLESALEKGDAARAGQEADRILAAVPDLKKSRPHKNVKQRKQFVAAASGLESSVKAVAGKVREGDLAAARGTFKDVEAQCAACHERFRD